MEMLRNRTKEIRIGNVWIGGSHPVAIQSMTKDRGCGGDSGADSRSGGSGM